MPDETTGTTQAPNTQTGGGQQPAAQAATFTQEQLNHIIDERLTRERAKYADYDELKKFREEQDAKNKSDLEKLTEAKNKAEAEAKRTREESTTRLLNAEARAIAAELGFSKPDKAVKLADLTDAVKDGEVDSAKVKSALEALAKDMPELLSKTKTVPTTGATNPPKGSNDQKETDEQRRARLRGGGTVNDWFGQGSVINYPKPGQ